MTSIAVAFADIAALTGPKCASCRVPYLCCTSEACADTVEFARTYFGVSYAATGHPKLPMMGPEGCQALPHHRPLCSVHVCEQHLDGDSAFAGAYFDLRDVAEEALIQIIEGPQSAP